MVHNGDETEMVEGCIWPVQMKVSTRGLPVSDAGDETTKIETLFGIS